MSFVGPQLFKGGIKEKEPHIGQSWRDAVRADQPLSHHIELTLVATAISAPRDLRESFAYRRGRIVTFAHRSRHVMIRSEYQTSAPTRANPIHRIAPASPAYASVIARPLKSVLSRTLGKIRTLIEIYWGKPISLVVSPKGDVKSFSTIEQVHYWLRKKWPVSDLAQSRAIDRVEAAMECLGTVADARSAFLGAATTAGFLPLETLDHSIAA
ncbi:DUF982 domain-containing protein [Thioclava sp. F34-6]|uniref:DUF982 domain-containing protein n=1 Tax=Thioclava sp. F34-6 TaxID=1973003 RepID=UPI001F0B222B|nr:DUF982 domain-containing protein [Thioclava sp. F34-6]